MVELARRALRRARQIGLADRILNLWREAEQEIEDEAIVAQAQRRDDARALTDGSGAGPDLYS